MLSPIHSLISPPPPNHGVSFLGTRTGSVLPLAPQCSAQHTEGPVNICWMHQCLHLAQVCLPCPAHPSHLPGGSSCPSESRGRSGSGQPPGQAAESPPLPCSLPLPGTQGAARETALNARLLLYDLVAPCPLPPGAHHRPQLGVRSLTDMHTCLPTRKPTL